MPDSAATPASLVALRDRRDQVIAQLTEQFARESFDVDELDRRLTVAQQAETVAALDALVADLPTLADPAATTALLPRPDDATLAQWPARRSRLAIFGGFEKKGVWRCPRQLRVIAAFGGADLDFREAVLAPGVTELKLVAMFGGVDIIVPPTLAVECDASAIFGGVDELHRAPRTADPDRPILRITGLVMFGGVDIQTRLPGESGRDARKRAKREAKALRAGTLGELPAGKRDRE